LLLLWVLCVADGSRSGGPNVVHAASSYSIRDEARAAIRSARVNTSLEIACVYDGVDPEFLAFLALHHVHRVDWTCIREDVYRPDHTALERNRRAGVWMRMDIAPLFRDRDYILYTDCDVIFNKDVIAESLTLPSSGLFSMVYSVGPGLGTADHVNTGVMVINVKNTLRELPHLIQACEGLNWGREFSEEEGYFEGVINRTYTQSGSITPLSRLYNWRPWWGVSQESVITHFHGSKPPHLVQYLQHGIASSNLPDYCRALWKVSTWSPYSVDMNREIAEHYVSLFKKYAGAR
jgi:lipopolysaccharide biosynthesis glycosyltransferase